MYRKNWVNFKGLKKIFIWWPNPFLVYSAFLSSFSAFFPTAGGEVAVLPKFLVPVSLVCSCSESEIIKDVGEDSTELSFAWRWFSRDGCAQRTPRPHGPSRVYYRERKKAGACVQQLHWAAEGGGAAAPLHPPHSPPPRGPAPTLSHQRKQRYRNPEVEFLNFYGAKKSIPRNRFRQPM